MQSCLSRAIDVKESTVAPARVVDFSQVSSAASKKDRAALCICRMRF